MEIWYLPAILILSCFIGYFVVWGVTPALHSPLMSVSNAVSGVIIIGALSATGAALTDVAGWTGLAAVFFAAVNIFGGFAVSHRMLMMFRRREKK